MPDLLADPSAARLIPFGVGPYREILSLQQTLHARRLADEIPDSWLLGEHPAVITQGVRATEADLLSLDCSLSLIPVVQIDRGGMTTLHSPGQLILYPIVKLASGSLGAGQLARALLETMRAWIAREFSVETEIPEKRPGLFVDGRKLLSVGVSVRQGVSMHGVALNMCNDLSLWRAIVPCGEASTQPVSLSDLFARRVEPAAQIDSLSRSLRDDWRYQSVETVAPAPINS